MKLKKLLSICLVLILVALPVTVNAASNGSISFGDLIAALTSGPCGENLTWSLDKNGTLTIAGTGPMEDYESSAGVPWYIKSTLVKSVVIESGVTAISSYAFADCTELTEVHYKGTQEKWSTVSVGSNNDPLLNATMYFEDGGSADLNGDGAMDTDDAVYLLLHVMFGSEDYPAPDGMSLDFNSDSKLDTNDAVYLLLHVMFGAEDYPLAA